MGKTTYSVTDFEGWAENAEYIIEHGCHDYTTNGECSKCGGCCSCSLPLTQKEIRHLKRIVRERNMKPQHKLPVVCMSIDMTCPFLTEEHLCAIYDERPYICKVFKCDKKASAEEFEQFPNGLILTNVWDFFK